MNTFESPINQTDLVKEQKTKKESFFEVEGRLSEDSVMSLIKTRLIEELEPVLEKVIDTRSDLREKNGEFFERAKSIEDLEKEAGEFFKSLIPEGLEHDYYDKGKKVDILDIHWQFSRKDRRDHETADSAALRSRKHYRHAHEQLSDLNVFVEGDTSIVGSFNERLTKRGDMARAGIRRVVQREGENLIYENVETLTPSDKKKEWFYVGSELFIKNINSGLGLNLGALLPHNYEFKPSVMQEAGVHDIDSYFNGDKAAEERFVASSSKSEDRDEVGSGYVGYGDMRETGSTISLFHEIAHAWQRNYSRSYGGKGRQTFDAVYSKTQGLLDDLDQIKRSPDSNTEEKMQRAESIESELKNLDISPAIEADAGTIGTDIPLHDENVINIQGKLKDSARKSAEEEFHRAFILEKNGAREEDVKEAIKKAWSLIKTVYYPVRSMGLKEKIDSFISEERDAWAHSLRMLRFLRSKGLDVEPGLKTLKDFKAYIDPCLDSYQHSLEKMVSVGELGYRFSRAKSKS